MISTVAFFSPRSNLLVRSTVSCLFAFSFFCLFLLADNYVGLLSLFAFYNYVPSSCLVYFVCSVWDLKLFVRIIKG